jgi:hypothetical protein
MGMDKDTTKDLVVGGIGAVAAATGIPGLAAVFAATVASVGWNRLARSAQKRAEKLVEHMILTSDDPATFAEELKRRAEANDAETLAAFRALLLGAMQAVSDESLPALGFVGRRYFQGECVLWRARAAVAIINEFDGRELRQLRQLATELASVEADSMIAVSDMPLRSNGEEAGWYAQGRGLSDMPRVRLTTFANPDRVFGWLKRCGLATDTGAYGLGGSPSALEIDRTSALLLRDALVAALADP